MDSDRLKYPDSKDLAQLCKHPEIKKLIPNFVGYWVGSSIYRYVGMSAAEGWLEAFCDKVLESADNEFFIGWLNRNKSVFFKRIPPFPESITSESIKVWATNTKASLNPAPH